MKEIETMCCEFWRQCYLIELTALTNSDANHCDDQKQAAINADIAMRLFKERLANAKFA